MATQREGGNRTHFDGGKDNKYLGIDRGVREEGDGDITNQIFSTAT